MEIKKLCIKYELGDSIHYVQNHLSKAKWKILITSAIYKYWSDRINEEIKYYSTLKYLSPTYEMVLKSDNVEFVRYCGGHFENGNRPV
jgi:hypothetical protein